MLGHPRKPLEELSFYEDFEEWPVREGGAGIRRRPEPGDLCVSLHVCLQPQPPDVLADQGQGRRAGPRRHLGTWRAGGGSHWL